MPGSVARLQCAFKEFVDKERKTHTVMTNIAESKKAGHAAERSLCENCDNKLKWAAAFFCLAMEEKP